MEILNTLLDCLSLLSVIIIVSICIGRSVGYFVKGKDILIRVVKEETVQDYKKLFESFTKAANYPKAYNYNELSRNVGLNEIGVKLLPEDNKGFYPRHAKTYKFPRPSNYYD